MSKEQAEKYLPKPIAMRDYEITKTIGKGEFSIVKLAKTSQNNKFYAMKKIKVDKKKIDLKEPIKILSIKRVDIKLFEGVVGTVKVATKV